MVNCNSPLFPPRAVHGMPGERGNTRSPFLCRDVSCLAVSQTDLELIEKYRMLYWPYICPGRCDGAVRIINYPPPRSANAGVLGISCFHWHSCTFILLLRSSVYLERTMRSSIVHGHANQRDSDAVDWPRLTYSLVSAHYLSPTGVLHSPAPETPPTLRTTLPCN